MRTALGSIVEVVDDIGSVENAALGIHQLVIGIACALICPLRLPLNVVLFLKIDVDYKSLIVEVLTVAEVDVLYIDESVLVKCKISSGKIQDVQSRGIQSEHRACGLALSPFIIGIVLPFEVAAYIVL